MVCAACAEPPSCECVEVSVLRINDAQLRTDVRRTIGLSYDECLVFPGRQASEVGQEVVDERDRLMVCNASVFGLSAAPVEPVAITRSIGKPSSRRFRSRARSNEASTAETQASSWPTSCNR